MSAMANRLGRTGATVLAVALFAPSCPRPAPAWADGLTLSSAAVAPDSVPNGFTRYLVLTGSARMPDTGIIWITSSSRLDGRVHTNTQLAFMGEPYFGDTVSSVDERAWFYNQGTPKQLADDHNGTIDVPYFERGFLRGVAPVPLPADSHDQQKAALGLSPDGSAPTNPEIRVQLGLPPASSPPPDGVYLVSSWGVTTGGLYVQGDASQILASADTVPGLQVYRIAQDSTVRTITIDPAANTTTVAAGSTTTTYLGTPHGVLFVDGGVSDLRGPDRIGRAARPALLDGQRLLIAATGDIVLQRDLAVQRFDEGTAVLGIFSSGGSVRIGTGAPDEMLLDAFVMAVGSAGAFTVDDYGTGPPRGAFHLRGGVVGSFAGPFGTFDSRGEIQTGYGRDFRHDRRGLVPPWYPDFPPPTVGVTTRAETRTLHLSSPRPNPAWMSFRVRYSLSRAGPVRLSLYDVLGRRVATLVDAEQPAGEHEAAWAFDGRSGRAIRPGLYLLELESLGERARSRVALVP